MLPRPEQGGHVILVTSTLPGEGKTFTSANLAAAFAYAGKKVLLIDGDFRKSSLTRRLGGSGRKGLTSILLQQSSDTTGTIRPLGENSRGMDILYTGPMVPNPVTLLSHPLLGQILGILKNNTTPLSSTLRPTALWLIPPFWHPIAISPCTPCAAGKSTNDT